MTVFHSQRDDGTGTGGAHSTDGSSRLQGAAQQPRRLPRGARLYGFGDPCRTLYVVQRGTLKSLAVSDDGLTQVTAFPMAGDVLGLDGIYTGAHQNETIALEDCEVTALPLKHDALGPADGSGPGTTIMRAIAADLVRCQRLAVMLGTMRSEQRVAIFLVDLAGRQARIGGSPEQFALRMQRRDIASYLGLKIETVSRAFSHLQHEGIIAVDGKSIRVLDAKALDAVSGAAPRAPG